MRDVLFSLSSGSALAAAFAARLLVVPAAAADLPTPPSSFPPPTPTVADATPDYWSGLYFGSGISVWGGKGVKGGVGGDAYLGYDHVYDNGVVLGVRASTGYAPYLWSTPSGFTQFTGTAYAGGEAIIGYDLGQVRPYFVTGVDFIRPTRFGVGGFNAGDAINSVFSGPGAVQAVGTVGVGVIYQVTPNFSFGVEARVHNNPAGLGAWP
jgi:opacity protein-like surface antigen